MNNTKKCAKCQYVRDISEFHKAARMKDGLDSWCKDCRREYARAWRKDSTWKMDPAKRRDNNLRRNYGITAEEYNDILAEQEYLCKICGADSRAVFINFHVDHDHSCCPGSKSCGTCIRGIICGKCNLALGQVGDNVDTLRNMIEYLDS